VRFGVAGVAGFFVCPRRLSPAELLQFAAEH